MKTKRLPPKFQDWIDARKSPRYFIHMRSFLGASIDFSSFKE